MQTISKREEIKTEVVKRGRGESDKERVTEKKKERERDFVYGILSNCLCYYSKN